MEKIASFTIDHIRLLTGIYVSRKDTDPETGATLTTFDLRMTKPNREPVMNTAELHTLEHLLATFLRNDSEWSSRIVYVGPMGCRTGMYLIVFGDVSALDIAPLVTRVFEQVLAHEGDIPGAQPAECGNYLDQNLEMAKWLARRYLNETLYKLDETNTNYPA